MNTKRESIERVTITGEGASIVVELTTADNATTARIQVTAHGDPRDPRDGGSTAAIKLSAGQFEALRKALS